MQTKKLVLAKETLRTLTAQETQGVVGGRGWTTITIELIDLSIHFCSDTGTIDNTYSSAGAVEGNA